LWILSFHGICSIINAKEIRKAIRKQLQYIKRDLRYIDGMLQDKKLPPDKFAKQL